MARKIEVKTVAGNRYRFTQMGADNGLRVAAQLMSLGLLGGTDGAALLSGRIKISPEVAVSLADDLFQTVELEEPVTHTTGVKMTYAALSRDVWREHFVGRYAALFEVLAASVAHSFGDFLGVKGTSEASPSPQNSEKP
jgi:hypothetical protein